MNENENLQPVQKLTPFTKMVMSIGTLPSSFYASMSYYESMVWLYEYLKNQVIPTVNNNAEAVEELQAKYIEFSSGITDEVTDFKTYINGKVDELETYMNDYFTNLDVQEEINNKLDKMAEDGTMTNLIKGYIDPLYQAYETEINNAIDDQNDEITSFKSSVNNQINTIDNKVESAISGSPKGVYSTVSDLTAANPNHDYVYLVLSDGKWYYYNTSSSTWTAGGTYQATGISDTLLAEINKNSISRSKLDNNNYILNNENLKAGYEYQNITIRTLDVANTHNGYYASIVEPIPVRTGDKIEINQPESNKLFFKYWIKQSNGIIYTVYSWLQNLTEFYIPMTGDLYIEFQNGTNHITADDVLERVTLTRTSDIDIINNTINNVEEENLKYLKYKFSNVTYNESVNTLHTPNNDVNTYRIYTTETIHLPYDLKISLDKSISWNYELLIAFYDEEESLLENQIVNYGSVGAGKDIIVPKNSYSVVGIKNTDNTTFDYRTILPYINFEKIDENYRLKDKTYLSINHRGYGSFPENNILAYKEAYRQGFRAVECDVRKTSDDVYVLLHDPSINRVARNADGTSLSSTVNIADITYEQALTYDFGIYQGEEFAGTKISTLESLLSLCRNLNIYLCMELESGALNGTDITNIVNMVHNYNMQNNCLIMSANFGLVKNVVENDKYIDVGYVNWNNLTEVQIFTFYGSLKTPYNRMFFIDDSTKYLNHLQYYKKYNANLIVWTINTEQEIIDVDPYVNGIESDYLVASNVLQEYELE